MSDENRIKLAEAMEWTPLDHKLTGWWMPPGVKIDDHILMIDRVDAAHLPDPFTDANDDVAVLTYFQNRAVSHPDEWQVFKDYFMDVRADWNIWNYSIGLFARAALKVIK